MDAESVMEKIKTKVHIHQYTTHRLLRSWNVFLLHTCTTELPCVHMYYTQTSTKLLRSWSVVHYRITIIMYFCPQQCTMWLQLSHLLPAGDQGTCACAGVHEGL